MQRHAQALGDGRAIAVVAVEELEDGRGLTECRDSLVEAVAVEDVDQPDPAAGPDRV